MLFNTKPVIKNLNEYNAELLVKCNALLDRVTKRDLSSTTRLLFEKNKAMFLSLLENSFNVMSWIKRKITSRANLLSVSIVIICLQILLTALFMLVLRQKI